MEMLADTDWNAFVNGENLPLIVFLILAAVVLVTAIIALHWRRVRVAEAEASVKLRMIERGYSADEIERVLQAKLGVEKHNRHHHPARAQGCCSSDFV